MTLTSVILAALFCGSVTGQAAFSSTYSLYGRELHELLPVTISCQNQGVGSQAYRKVTNLLNQDMTTLNTYFNEKCAELNDIYDCSMRTARQVEEKICELRLMKSRLFPQGTNAPPTAITSFDCGQYTSEEKRGCPRPKQVTTTTTTATTGTTQNVGNQAGTFNFGTSTFPFLTNPGGLANPNSNSQTPPRTPPQPVRNNWDRVINEKVREYENKMAVYRNSNPSLSQGAFGSGVFGTRLYASSSLAEPAATQRQAAFPFATNTGTSSATTSTFTYPARPSIPTFTTNTGTSSTTNTGTTLTGNPAVNSQATTTFGTNPYLVRPAGFPNRFTPSTVSYPARPAATSTLGVSSAQTYGYPGTSSLQQYSGSGTNSGFMSAGFGGGLNSQILRQAQELKRCLPPGSTRDSFGGYFPIGLVDDYYMKDPLLQICVLRNNPQLFDELEENLVRKFLTSASNTCDNFPVEVQNKVNEFMNAANPMTLIQRSMSDAQSTLQNMLIENCAWESIEKKLKAKDTALTATLNCNQFQSELQPLKDEVELNEELRRTELELTPFSSSFGSYGFGSNYYDQGTVTVLADAIYCMTPERRNVAYSQYENVKKAVCVADDMGAAYSPFGYSSVIGIGMVQNMNVWRKLYIARPILTTNQPRDTAAGNIWDNRYDLLTTMFATEPATVSQYLTNERSLLTTAAAVRSQSASSCNGIIPSNAAVSRFVNDLDQEIQDCQGTISGPVYMYDVKEKMKEIFEELSVSSEVNNRLKICMIYAYTSRLPQPTSSAGSEAVRIRNDMETLVFAEMLFDMVKEQVEKAAQVVPSDCDARMNQQARRALQDIVSKFTTGDITGLKNDEETMLSANPTALTEAQRTEYLACEAKKVSELANGPLCSPFGTAMSAVRQDVVNKVNQFRNNQPVNLKREILKILKQPFTTSSVSNACNRNLDENGQCPAGFSCCPQSQSCENGQCFSVWQKKFCQRAAVSQGMGSISTDTSMEFMKMMRKESVMGRQALLNMYNKYPSTSQECTRVLGVDLGAGTQTSTLGLPNFGNPFQPVTNFAGTYAAGYGSQSPRYYSAYSTLSSSVYSLGSLTQMPCQNQDSAIRFVCAWQVVYDSFKNTACLPGPKTNPLFPTYDYINSYTPPDMCSNPGQPIYTQPFGQRGQSNEDCDKLREARRKSLATGEDTGFIVMMMYKEKRGGLYGGIGGFGSPNFYSSSAYSSNTQTAYPAATGAFSGATGGPSNSRDSGFTSF